MFSVIATTYDVHFRFILVCIKACLSEANTIDHLPSVHDFIKTRSNDSQPNLNINFKCKRAKDHWQHTRPLKYLKTILDSVLRRSLIEKRYTVLHQV